MMNAKVHYMNVHVNKITCNVCNKSFALKHHLRRHIKESCLNSPNSKCNLCEKYFRDKVDLKIHMHNIHGSECSDYDKYFGSNNSNEKSTEELDWKNMKSNENGRITCLDCKGTFSSLQNIRRHYKEIHMGKK